MPDKSKINKLVRQNGDGSTEENAFIIGADNGSTVDGLEVRRAGSTNAHSALPFVAAGGTPPAGATKYVTEW